jgi:PhnB protein
LFLQVPTLTTERIRRIEPPESPMADVDPNAGMVGYSVVPAERPREGFHSVTPRIVVDDVAAQVEFLRIVFGATGSMEPGRPAEIQIGDSLVMVSPADERASFQAFLYVYVDDADATYRRALNAGAISVEEPLETPYGDRRAMVRDPFGNIFQIAHQVT